MKNDAQASVHIFAMGSVRIECRWCLLAPSWQSLGQAICQCLPNDVDLLLKMNQFAAFSKH
ncbi:hypothetical protein V8Z74_03945 [Comamonas sp. w2-DMI]|uniref:hypothetical protein n=1 Tax=Comamonas sp. w2-DMI TaxID=3126391 RepID=UPI0032E4FB85